MTARRRWIGALLVCLTRAPAAFAGELGVVATAEPPGPVAPLPALAAELRDALRRRSGDVVPGEILRERMGGGPSPAVLAAAEQAHAGALAAHAAGDFEGALGALRALVADLERLPPSPEIHRQWIRTMLRLARAEQSAGRQAEAQDLLERLHRVVPDLEADARQYPPSFLRLLTEAASRVRAQPRRRLAVVTSPGVSVLVEGREVGEGSLTVPLAPGRYRISGRRGGRHVPGPTVDLGAGDGSASLDAERAAVYLPEAGPGLALSAADRAERLPAVAAGLGMDRLVAVWLRDGEAGSELVAVHVEARRGTVEREGTLRLPGGLPPPGGLDALAEYLLSGRPSPLLEGPAGAAEAGPPRAVPAPTTAVAPEPAPPGRALGWTALGAGGASLLLGVYSASEGIRATARYADARAMQSPDGGVRPPYTVAQHNALVRAGDRSRNAAIAAGAGAGVTLAAAALLGYLSWRQSGEVGPLRF
ncbi:MAG: hypothetical protein HZB56_13910 [Deltaproteobacteria bacterium]|nr:hypothetical protein [Deltaproteobacteria bacterium]